MCSTILRRSVAAFIATVLAFSFSFTAVAPANATGPCPVANVTASTSVQLAAALAAAVPGDVIQIADGTYDGNWAATTAGTAAAPIWLCGSVNAILTNGGIQGAHGLHLTGTSYWHLYGFSITSAQKGVVVDGAHDVTVEALTIYGIGDEGIHLRSFTTDSLVTYNTIHDTGLRRQKFGEGVYVGSSDANWGILTGGLPDRSDRNTVAYNTIYRTPTESVDAKEGTTGGLIIGNIVDGSGLTGPLGEGEDSWFDIKGNDWTITGNTGVHSTGDGFQTHHRNLTSSGLGNWGLNNLFTNNTIDVQGPGYGVKIHDASITGNVVKCDNVVTNALLGFSNNGACTP